MKKFLKIAGAVILFLIVALIAASFLAEEPLRQYIEKQLNRSTRDFSVSIGALGLHPFSLSAELKKISVAAKVTPSQPLVRIETLATDVQLSSIVKGRVAADVAIQRPRIDLDLDALMPLSEKKKAAAAPDWRETLRSTCPFEITELTVSNGEISLAGPGPLSPVQMSNISFSAHDISNRPSPDEKYPARVSFEAVVAGKGKVTVDGRADFLSGPFPAVRADFVLDRLPLVSFDLAAGRMFNLDIDRGTLHVEGHVQYGPDKKSVTLGQVLLQGARIDYYFTGKEKVPLPEKGKATGMPVTIQKLRIENSEFGFINKATTPDYRVFISSVNATMTDFSTGFGKGPAKLDLHGSFMGSGETDVYATIRPEKQGPDFDLRVSISDTNMRTMNNLFRAYGKFDVAAGQFSFFSELNVKNAAVHGYVKPIFKEVNVHDERQDEKESFFKETYEVILDALSELFENPREAVATKAPVSGKLKRPDLNTREAVENLIQNAFFRSILPGFARSIE